MKRPAKLAAVVLAAGRSTRMGADNKLLLEVEPGEAMIRRTVEHATACGLKPLYVVTGHEEEKVRAALAGMPCRFVHNPDYADGLSGSIRAGFRRAIADGASGVVVLLGDMPFLPADAIAAVLQAAAADPDRIVQAVSNGEPAHPVWLPARLAGLVERLHGDQGMRGLAARAGQEMVSVEVAGEAAIDIDTPEDYAAARRD